MNPTQCEALSQVCCQVIGNDVAITTGAMQGHQYAVLCGESTGEVPVGVETRGNEDLPYWPGNNNATYREVWIGAAGRLLLLCADFGG